MARELVKAVAPTPAEAVALYHCYTDFILSREAILVSPQTIRFYKNTAGRFIRWLIQSGKTTPQEIVPRDVRAYLKEFTDRKAKASYIHGQARAIRTLLKFLHDERYITEPVKFQMPPSGGQEKLPFLTAEEVQEVLDACKEPRDKALILLMVDSGLRRSEVVALNWSDVDIKSGVVNVQRGKGGKSRSVVIGAKSRRALLTYRRTLENPGDGPLFQTPEGGRLTASGLRSALLRIGERAGIHLSAHALRRTFATLTLRAGMSEFHLQGLLGHTTLEMTRRYTQLVDDDLIEAHHDHGPVDKMLK